MFLSSHRRKTQRKGSVTIIVMAFLILFLVLGLTFALESQWRRTSAQIHLQGEFGGHTGVVPVARTGSGTEAPPIPSDIFNRALGYVIYDAPDDPSGVWVSSRGHSLARAMFGYNSTPGGNLVPYNGIGRVRGNPAPSGSGLPDDFTAVHYIPYNTTGTGIPNAVRDPEWIGERLLNAPKTGIYIPGNPNYTYPDLNNMYLGVVDPSTGQVVIKSFDRPWIYGNAAPPFEGYNGIAIPPTVTANPWTSAAGRHQILRPRPIDHVFNGTSEFPYPRLNADGSWGDVANLEGKFNRMQYDSFWLDFDLPVRTWRGKNYKPLVALLIVDHDGRVNLNVAGSRQGSGGIGHSNQGWGPWEMPINNLVGSGANLMNGVTFAGLPVTGKFGNPGGGSSVQKRALSYAQTGMADPNYGGTGEVAGDHAPWVSPGHFYARFDYDGSFTGTINNMVQAKAANPSPALFPFATNVIYGNTAFKPGTGINSYNGNSPYHDGQTAADRGSHPLLFNPYLTRWLPDTTTNVRDTAFPPDEMRWLNHKYMYNQREFQFGRLGKLVASTLGEANTSNNAVSRWQTTTFSNDIDRPGGSAWTMTSTNFAQGAPNPYPVLSGLPENATIGTANPFQNASGQLLANALTGIDINRPLTDYRNSRSVAFSATSVNNPTRYDMAVRDRQNLARDIFERLVLASGMKPFVAADETQGTARYNAYRQLAQYAVNLVDFIDTDDYSTPFNWNPTQALLAGDSSATMDAKMRAGWVFGVERPRLVINEAYVRYENDPADAAALAADPLQPLNYGLPTLGYQVKVYLELNNILTPPNANEIGLLSDGGAAVLTTTGGQQNYRILITKQNVDLPKNADAVNEFNITPGHPENVLGWPNTGVGTTGIFGNPGNPPMGVDASVVSIVTFANNSVVPPNLLSGTPQGPNFSYAIVGPDDEWDGVNNRYNLPERNPMMPENTLPDATQARHVRATGTGLQYIVPLADLVNVNATNPAVRLAPWAPTFLLQKLACQHVPTGADLLLAPNPYITIDVMDLKRPGQPEDYFLNDNLRATYGTDGGRLIANFPNNLGNHRSAVRRTPMNNRTLGLIYGTHPNGAAPHRIQQNLGRANNNLIQPFPPYVHLDRMIASVGELMMAPQVRQYEVNTYFFQFNPAAGQTRWAHVIPWQQNNGRLYRALDLFRPRSQISHMAYGGRIPGRININSILPDTRSATLTPPGSGSSVFDSLVDAAHSSGVSLNNFSLADRNNAYAALMAIRNGPDGIPYTEDDRPFVGSFNPDAPLDAAGNSTDRFAPHSGLRRTLYQANLFHRENLPAGWNQYEMLSKVGANLTTRSNCFAVYATIGYFEVRNPGPYHSGNRPILGKELGIDDGTNVRHRFFALVDRTNLNADLSNLSLAGQPNVYFSYEPFLGYEAMVPEPGSIVQIAIPANYLDAGTLYGNYDGTIWIIRPGISQLTIGYGSNQQNLTVTAVSINNALAGNPTGILTVTLPPGRKYHRGEVITLRNPNPMLPPSTLGNPGPQSRFNYNSPLFRAVVPYVEQIN